MTSNKAEGGVVALLGGGSVIGNPKNTRNGILGLYAGSSEEASEEADQDAEAGMSDGEAGAGAGTSESEISAAQEASGGYGYEPDADQEDSGRGGDYSVNDEGQFSGYGASYGKSIEDAIKSNPQLKGFLGKKISSLLDKGKVRSFEFDKKGNITGVRASTKAPGLLGLLGPVNTYTGYGKGFDDMVGGSGDNGDDSSEMIKKIVEEKKKEEDLPLSQEQIDYYTRGMGTATKPLKSLGDVNEYMSDLVGTTTSPTGAKLSENKKFLILPNGKVINLMTGKVQESMSGLELFAGGMI
jgi:hypothetical protein